MFYRISQFCFRPQVCGFYSAHIESVLATARDWSFSMDPQTRGDFRMPDLEDISQARQGDSEAYRRLIERHQPRVGKLLWRFTRDRTNHEELVQETFVQAYYSLHTYKAQAPFEHWLSCIATRVGYRFWKDVQKHRHADLLDSDWEQLSQADPDGMTPEQAAEILHSLLEKLPPRDRLVLTLRFVEQCDIEETARRTGWSQALVKVQTHRAKQKLKKLLEKADMELDL
jgi:RNA polymerase sigma-70 factor (ECF subfamily)